MSLVALSLMVGSAFLHMGWNLLMKQAGDRYIVSWWALLAGAIGFLPVALNAGPALQPVWGYALASAAFQLLYYLMLGVAYKSGDFSLVYPIARGSAPILIALWAVFLLHESISRAGLLGLVTIVLGILLIGGSSWRGQVDWKGRPALSTVAPFLIALCISGYSVIDGAAVKQAPPFPYTVLSFGLSALLFTPLVWVRHGWPTLVAVGRRQWWRIGLIGACTYAAYGLVLTAYSLAPVSYVGAVREVSIVLAALAGWLWLGESFGLTRTVGSLVVVAGIVLVTLAG
jgi:drug/metabolite transporter (DMT)-like permease